MWNLFSSSENSSSYGIHDRNIKLSNEQITVRVTGKIIMDISPGCNDFQSVHNSTILNTLVFHCACFL